MQSAQAQLLQYTFNDTGTTTTNAGSLTGANLTFENAAGTATDLHSAASGGVSGQATDLAFNNTASTTQGGTTATPGSGGVALNATANPFNGLTAFTLTGWYNVSATAPFGSGARLIDSGNQLFTLNFNSANLALGITTGSATAITNTVSTTNSIANAVGSWVYFAATYDGTTLRLYLGNTATTAASAASVAATGTLTAGNGIYLGNVSALNRPFQGSMDDVRLYSSALTTAQVDAIQTADAANLPAAVPEPSSVLALGVLALGGFALCRHRPKTA